MEGHVRARYLIYVCANCGDQHQFAGFCYDCNKKLLACSCLPVAFIRERKDEFVANNPSSTADAVAEFVENLLSSSESRKLNGVQTNKRGT